MVPRGRGQSQQAREHYRAMSVAEFFARNKELAGFSNPVRAIYQTIRELVENSLDATDAQGILPEIKIRIEEAGEFSGENGKLRKRYRITVEDNGIGVPIDSMANAFGRVLFSSKYVIRQTRGMYGLGVKAAVLYGQMTAGTPAEVVSATKGGGYVHLMKLMIDIRRNEPKIIERGQWRKRGSWHGTRVSITLEADWNRARSRILEYIKRTAIIAPYAEIILETPEGTIYYFPRSTKKLPKPPKKAKPHPHGIDIEQLKSIIRNTKSETLEDMLVREFQSVGRITARKFLEELGLDPSMSPKTLLRKGNEKLLTAMVDFMKSYKGFRSPRSDYLSPIGEDLIKIGLMRMFNPEWASAVTRTPKAYQGHPFIVEVGIAYGGDIRPVNEPLLLRYANKIPLLYEEREDVSYKVLSSINWKNYNIDFPAPMVVLVHIASTKIPYKGVGKESISDVPEIESEIRNAMLEVARRLRIFISKKKREEEAMRRITVFAKYIPEIARSLAILSKPPDKWSPPKPEEERKIMEALIRLVSNYIEIPELPGEERKSTEEVVRSVIEEIEVE